ncbi:MAG: hypothetical protein ACTH4U_15250 [Pseudoalteromonas prydzensis]|uniref:hypothetical protein n=1 Tax=Pseudoalteromonas TaxID=53246 RepID=UPI0039FBB55D
MKKIISTEFNVFATFALLLVMFIFTLFTVDVSAGYGNSTLLDLLFTQFWLKVLFSLLLLIGVAITISYIFKEIWNRLLCDLFQVREVNINEAYSISVLLVSLVAI